MSSANDAEMKRILFVINTLGNAGAEKALLELLKRLEKIDCELFLYVLMGQGEMFSSLPSGVKVLNSRVSTLSVLSKEGRGRMVKTVFAAFGRNGNCLRKLWYTAGYLIKMLEKRRIQIDKLLWRLIAEGAERFEESFDLAVAWLEGGSAYYVSDYVRASKKAAFIHIDYGNAGYTREMDRDCWRGYDRIYCISDGVKECFLQFYPEYISKTRVFHNLIDREEILLKSRQQEGFSDDFGGMRLLTVGRLTYQKGYDIAVRAMKILKEKGVQARWYVLGEGELRGVLEKQIETLGLKKDFILLGAVQNPYPYFVQADIYVHATRYEGKSMALQEAQILGCAVVASDCSGNREQVLDGRDGILCALTPEAVAESISFLVESEEMRKRLGQAAREKKQSKGQETALVWELFS